MTVVEPPDTTSRRRIVAATAAVAVAVGAGGWWVTHPDALEPVGSSTKAPVPVGDSAVVTMFAHPRSGEVRLVSAEPVVAENSADAVVRVLLCGNPTDLPVNTTVGFERGRADDVCSSTSPPQDAELGRVSSQAPYLVVEVTPRAPGTVTVDGLRVEYRTGLQRGRQDSGLNVTLHTPAGG